MVSRRKQQHHQINAVLQHFAAAQSLGPFIKACSKPLRELGFSPPPRPPPPPLLSTTTSSTTSTSTTSSGTTTAAPSTTSVFVGQCRDDPSNSLLTKVTQHFGKATPLHGLGGLCSAGKSAFLAAQGGAEDSLEGDSSPAGADGRRRHIYVFAPHIGIGDDGELLGMEAIGERRALSSTPSRSPTATTTTTTTHTHTCSGACNTLVAFQEELKRGIINPSFDFNDLEMSALKAAVLPHLDIIKNGLPSLKALTLAAKDAMVESLLSIIHSTVDTLTTDYAVIVGIQVHGPGGRRYWVPDEKHTFAVVHGERVWVRVPRAEITLDVEIEADGQQEQEQEQQQQDYQQRQQRQQEGVVHKNKPNTTTSSKTIRGGDVPATTAQHRGLTDLQQVQHNREKAEQEEDEDLQTEEEKEQGKELTRQLRFLQTASNLRKNLIGRNRSFLTPFGIVPVVYADWTASGRMLTNVEGFISKQVLPFYGNTHTTTSITGRQTTYFREEARHIIAKAVGANIKKTDDDDHHHHHHHHEETGHETASSYSFGCNIRGGNPTGTTITTTTTTGEAPAAGTAGYSAMHNGDEDVVIFTGSGTTAAIALLVSALGLHGRTVTSTTTTGGVQGRGSGTVSRQLDGQPTSSALSSPITDDSHRPVVFVGPWEHHSNLLPWRESGAEVVVINECYGRGLDLEDLTLKLDRYSNEDNKDRLKIGSFAAASNVTGALCDTFAVAALLHRAGALSFWDYATAAPHVKMEMNPVVSGEDAPYVYKDAIFISGHKFVGGPGTPGVLIVKKRLLTNAVPTVPGGGTVIFVSPSKHAYTDNVEEREEGGTPNILGAIRMGLVMRLKEDVSATAIMEREDTLCEHALARLVAHPNIEILGDINVRRLPIFSFLVKHPGSGGKFLHHNFISALLNDLFGVQTRGGCACAGPYVHTLLSVSAEASERMMSLLMTEPASVLKPGFTRFSITFFMTEQEVEYILKAVEFVASYGAIFLPFYQINHKTGEWSYSTSLSLASCFDDDVRDLEVEADDDDVSVTEHVLGRGVALRDDRCGGSRRRRRSTGGSSSGGGGSSSNRSRKKMNSVHRKEDMRTHVRRLFDSFGALDDKDGTTAAISTTNNNEDEDVSNGYDDDSNDVIIREDRRNNSMIITGRHSLSSSSAILSPQNRASLSGWKGPQKMVMELMKQELEESQDKIAAAAAAARKTSSSLLSSSPLLSSSSLPSAASSSVTAATTAEDERRDAVIYARVLKRAHEHLQTAQKILTAKKASLTGKGDPTAALQVQNKRFFFQANGGGGNGDGGGGGGVNHDDIDYDVVNGEVELSEKEKQFVRWCSFPWEDFALAGGGSPIHASGGGIGGGGGGGGGGSSSHHHHHHHHHVYNPASSSDALSTRSVSPYSSFSSPGHSPPTHAGSSRGGGGGSVDVSMSSPAGGGGGGRQKVHSHIADVTESEMYLMSPISPIRYRMYHLAKSLDRLQLQQQQQLQLQLQHEQSHQQTSIATPASCAHTTAIITAVDVKQQGSKVDSSNNNNNSNNSNNNNNKKPTPYQQKVGGGGGRKPWMTINTDYDSSTMASIIAKRSAGSAPVTTTTTTTITNPTTLTTATTTQLSPKFGGGSALVNEEDLTEDVNDCAADADDVVVVQVSGGAGGGSSSGKVTIKKMLALGLSGRRHKSSSSLSDVLSKTMMSLPAPSSTSISLSSKASSSLVNTTPTMTTTAAGGGGGGAVGGKTASSLIVKKKRSIFMQLIHPPST